MDPEEASWRRRRARMRGGQSRGGGGGSGGRGLAAGRFCLRLLGILLSSPGLLVLVVCYCLLGAALFRFLEREYETEKRKAVEKFREDCIKELWHITECLNVLYEKNWTAMVNERLRLFEMSVLAVTEAEGYEESNPKDVPNQQSFVRALFYSITIMTTIGFGKFGPKTPTSKILTMVFAVLGIPITMLCLANIGALLAHVLQNFYATIGPDKSTEILCPLTDKVECSSNPPLTPRSLEVRDLEEDFRGTTENPFPDGCFSVDHKHDYKIKNTAKKSNSMMLTTVNLPLDDPIQNLPGSVSSERHSLLVECAECIAEHNFSSIANSKVFAKKEGSSEVSVEEEISLDEVTEPLKSSGKGRKAACCEEERNDDQNNCLQAKEWKYGQHDTPSRIPLIRRAVTQSPHSLQHSLADTICPSLSSRPPTPIPTKCPSRKRVQHTKYDLESSPLAGSDRHLCSTPSLAAIPLDRALSGKEHIPGWIILSVLGAYICIGAALFALWEGWTFLDGAYFCFMLLSTIGFGDLITGNADQVQNSIQTSQIHTSSSHGASLSQFSFSGVHASVLQPWKLLACCTYLLVGLVLVSSSISLMLNKWADYVHALKTALGAFGNESSEGDEQGEESHDHRSEVSGSSFNRLLQREHD